MFYRKLLCGTALVALLLLGGCGNIGPDFRALINIDGEKAHGDIVKHHEKGKVELAAGRNGNALKAFQAALLYGPKRIEVLNAVGVTYDRLGRFDLARRYYNRALTLEPKSAMTLNNMGYSHLLQGKHDAALKYFQMAKRMESAPEQDVIESNLKRSIAMAEQAKTAVASAMNTDQASPLVRSWIQRSSLDSQALITKPKVALLEEADRLRVDLSLAGFLETQSKLGADKPAEEAPPIALVRPASIVIVSKLVEPAQPDVGVEVSNGAGRLRMAWRLGQYLKARNFAVANLTNAASFANQRSVIYYRAGARRSAERLADALPISIPLKLFKGKHGIDLRIKLGGDLLEHDRLLIKRFGNG